MDRLRSRWPLGAYPHEGLPPEQLDGNVSPSRVYSREPPAEAGGSLLIMYLKEKGPRLRRGPTEKPSTKTYQLPEDPPPPESNPPPPPNPPLSPNPNEEELLELSSESRERLEGEESELSLLEW